MPAPEIRSMQYLVVHDAKNKCLHRRSCFLQGVDMVRAYVPDAVWYDYETVRIFTACFNLWTQMDRFKIGTKGFV